MFLEHREIREVLVRAALMPFELSDSEKWMLSARSDAVGTLTV